jgi:hypothetical protein
LAGDIAFRKALDDFTSENSSNRADCAEWPERLNRLAREFPHHTIKVIDVEPDPGFNCITFAIGLHASKKHEEINRRTVNWFDPKVAVFANALFLRRLLNSQVLKISADQSEGLIVYFNEDEESPHAGHLSNNRVRSKWGTCWLVEHAIWEVPTGYGNDYRVYHHPDVRQMEHEFIEWAEKVRGVNTAAILSRIKG